MLRLILDAMQPLDVPGHPLRFLSGSKWYSEALLSSPFRPRLKQDTLSEGLTHADGVIGHFEFRPLTQAGLRLKPDSRQFVVVEAKMFSNLSSGTTNARGYNQAARNVACMAEAIAQSGMPDPLSSLESVGFIVVAPERSKRGHPNTNLEDCVVPESIRLAVHNRIAAYEEKSRKETAELRQWETKYFLPLVLRLEKEKSLAVLSWEQVIETINAYDPVCGHELKRFYDHCLAYKPSAQPEV